MEFVNYETAKTVLEVMVSAPPGDWHLTPMEQAAVRAAMMEIAQLRREKEQLADSWDPVDMGLANFMACESWPGRASGDSPGVAMVQTQSINDLVNAILAGRNAAMRAVLGG